MTDSLTVLQQYLQPEPWMDRAACKGIDPAVFQLEQGQSAASAREVCAQCPVTQECFAYASRTGSVGVWGGCVFSLNKKPKALPSTDGRPVRVSAPEARRRQSPAGSVPGRATIAASKAR